MGVEDVDGKGGDTGDLLGCMYNLCTKRAVVKPDLGVNIAVPRAVASRYTQLRTRSRSPRLRSPRGGLFQGMMDLSLVSQSRSARLAYLRMLRSEGFQNAAVSLNYTRDELSLLRGRLLDWSRSGRIGIELNPLLAGYATPDRVTVGLIRVLADRKPLQSATGHELIHMLQEIRYGALTMERAGQLTRSQVRFFEWQAGAGGKLTVGGMPGWFEEFYGWLASLKFPKARAD